jgi:hypothetical protein
VTQALMGYGHADAHGALPAGERATSRSGYPIDLIFGRQVTVVDAALAGAARRGAHR